MEPIRGLSGIHSPHQVQERNAGGNKQQADAFRRAMQEHRGQADGQPHIPMRRALQKRPQDGRKQEGEAMHVDVIA